MPLRQDFCPAKNWCVDYYQALKCWKINLSGYEICLEINNILCICPGLHLAPFLDITYIPNKSPVLSKMGEQTSNIIQKTVVAS